MTQIVDGWFEDNDDGSRDYVAVLENGETWRMQNVYLTSMMFSDLDCTTTDTITIEVSQFYS